MVAHIYDFIVILVEIYIVCYVVSSVIGLSLIFTNRQFFFVTQCLQSSDMGSLLLDIFFFELCWFQLTRKAKGHKFQIFGYTCKHFLDYFFVTSHPEGIDLNQTILWWLLLVILLICVFWLSLFAKEDEVEENYFSLCTCVVCVCQVCLCFVYSVYSKLN